MENETSPREVPPSRRRPKPTLSCTLCRRRKLKCDRQSPCKTCIDRGLSLSCTFVQANPTPHETRAPDSVHERINQLERLVTTLMANKGIEQPDPDPLRTPRVDCASDDEIPGTPDQVKLSKDTTTYTNSGHWTSILDGISELKDHLDQIPSSAHIRNNNSEDLTGPALLFGRQRHATKQELLASLPPRSEADQMILAYFESMEAAALLHRPSFLREYDAFWTRPFDTSTMWIGLLYSVLTIGAMFQSGTFVQGHETGAQSEILQSARMEFYREKAVQALILANYTKCPPYTVEACLLYFGTEFIRSSDTQFSTWILVGIIVRIALRMGYHRDPSHFANISPFKAELRRRTWTVILSIDLVSSAQVGLPRLLQPSTYDCMEPRNLEEDELYEEMTELPASRPEEHLTPLLYMIVITRVRTTYAKVLDLTNATSQPAYRDIMNLDKVLRHVYDKLPESAKVLSAAEFDDAVSTASMRRVYLGLSFLKAELVLHRPYLLLGRTDSRYEYSRRVCINAASEMLQLQQKLDAEIKPDGRLWSPGWQVFNMSRYMSSIVAQDFLLATTVLVLELDHDLSSPLPPWDHETESKLQLDRAPPSRDQIIALLLAAQGIWYRASERSNEARKVAEAIRLVLQKLNSENGPNDASVAHIPIGQQIPAPSFSLNDFAANPDYLAANENGHTYPFTFNNVPMDLDDFTNTLTWNPLPFYPQTYSDGSMQHQPPFQ